MNIRTLLCRYATHLIIKTCACALCYLGTRQDMVEALRLASEGKVRSVVERARLSDIAAAYERVKHGRVNGRIVIDMDAHRA